MRALTSGWRPVTGYMAPEIFKKLGHGKVCALDSVPRSAKLTSALSDSPSCVIFYTEPMPWLDC